MRAPFIALLLLLAPVAWAASTHTVGPDGSPASLAEAIQRAQDGDTIALLPGTYKGAVAVLRQRRLTLRGVGERPVIEADGKIAEEKAIWVIKNGEFLIENIEFRGARARDRNGAGIRFEQGRLTVRRCAFIDNEKGLLTANFGEAELDIEDSLFAQGARVGEQPNHLLYVGAIARLSLRGSRFHQGATGHLLKSRARENWLGYNLFADGPDGIASYEVEFPNGGEATLIGNVIAQGPRTENHAVLAYGAEGPRWPRNRLRLVHNTFVNQAWKPARYLRLWEDRLISPVELLAVNNLAVGWGLFEAGLNGQFIGNALRLGQPLAAPELLDFGLRADTPLRGSAGDAQALAPGLHPDAEFQLPIGTRPLAPPARWSPGAFQR